MSKQILILSRTDDRPDFDTAQSMVEQLNPSKHEVVYEGCFLEDLAFLYDGQKLAVINTNNGRDIKDYDGVFMLGWFKKRKHEDVALAAGRYMQSMGKKVLNSEAVNNRSRSKVSQYVLCALGDIPQAPFVFIGNRTRLLDIVDKSTIEYPLIVKSATGSRGTHNFLVNNVRELENALDEMPTKPAIIQHFVPNNGDYRILVMGGKVKLIIHRTSQDSSHLNNTSQGGKAALVARSDVKPRMLDDAVKISRALGREVTGVDMILDQNTGQHYFLEANNMPQLTTGSFVSEKAKALDDFFTEWIN